MNKWTNVLLGDLCDVTRGASPRPIHHWMTKESGGIPWVKISDATSSKTRFIKKTKTFIKKEGREKSIYVKRGDLILSNSATPGLPKLMDIEACIHDGWLLLRNFKGIHKDFLYYLLINDRKKIVSLGTGTIFTNLKTDILKKYQINLPSIPEQKEIASFLTLIDEKIENNQKTNQTLEKIAKTIFKSWFINYDPIKAKINKKSTGLSKEISNLFPDSFEYSELGKIPKRWEITKLKSIINIFGGQAFKSKDYTTDGVFVLRTKNFDRGIAENLSDDVFLPKTYLEIYKDFICEAFDYHLIMVGASIGKTGMILPNLLPALRNQNMWCFRPKNEELIPRFYTKFIVDVVTNELMGFASGSARDFFRRDIFKEYQLILPPKKILKSYLEITNPMLKRIVLNHKKMILLSSLKNIFISKLISGELKISDAKKLISEAST